MNKQEWSTALTSFVQTQRRENPVPRREDLSAEEEWHCRVLGGEFISWYQRDLPEICAERHALRVMSFDPDPLIVFTTSMPGLVASRQILRTPPDNLGCLLHTEFESWLSQHPLDDFTFHIHHWSYLRPVDQELLTPARANHPGITPAEFRIHTCGELWGERCGLERDHLWRWNGQSLELLAEEFSSRRF